NWLGLALLAEVRHEEEDPRQTLLAGIKKLVDQVFLDAGVPSQKVCHEPLGELRFVAENTHDGRLLDPHDDAFRHRHGPRYAHRMSVQATLTEEFTGPVERDDSLLSLL